MVHNKYIQSAIGFLITLTVLNAETVYIDASQGVDTNSGAAGQPVRTLARAAELVNAHSGPGPTTIKVAPGIYNVTETVLFSNSRQYTANDRLVIEARISPDDTEWRPELMPVILSTEDPRPASEAEGQIEETGLKIEVEHVTIRGLKFLGSPVPGIWYYPIFREGKNLDDLVVSQCLFTMDRHSNASNVGVLANGYGLVVDHCVFLGCRNPVVFWRAEGGNSPGNSMRYCIVEDAYTSAVWLCDTGDDFEFHHNIITNVEYVWMRADDNHRNYNAHDNIITDYRHYTGQYLNSDGTFAITDPGIVYHDTRVVKTGELNLIKGDGIDHAIPKYFMHPKEGTLGSDLGAGLFTK